MLWSRPEGKGQAGSAAGREGSSLQKAPPAASLTHIKTPEMQKFEILKSPVTF